MDLLSAMLYFGLPLFMLCVGLLAVVSQERRTRKLDAALAEHPIAEQLPPGWWRLTPFNPFTGQSQAGIPPLPEPNTASADHKA